jgi:multidrug transporter EmrE-like cation transporter
MGTELLFGLILAAATALATNLAFLWKHKGAVAAPDVDVRKPLRSAAGLFRSKWWTVGFIVAIVAWLLHVGALSLAPLSLAQAVISGGLVLLAVLAERFFGFSLERRQWIGVGLVAVGMAFLALTTEGDSETARYRLAAMIAFEAGLIGIGMALVLSYRSPRARERYGVLLGTAAGLLFGVSDIAIKALSGTVPVDLLSLVSPWTFAALIASIGAFYASARSLQIGEGIAVITATSAAANLSTIAGGVVVFGDSLGEDALSVVGRLAAFVLVIVAVALIPAPTRAADTMARQEAGRGAAEPEAPPASA